MPIWRCQKVPFSCVCITWGYYWWITFRWWTWTSVRELRVGQINPSIGFHLALWNYLLMSVEKLWRSDLPQGDQLRLKNLVSSTFWQFFVVTNSFFSYSDFFGYCRIIRNNKRLLESTFVHITEQCRYFKIFSLFNTFDWMNTKRKM